MNRKITNIIRYFMDECLPPIIRDRSWFMRPIHRFWFPSAPDLDAVMEFKEIAPRLNREAFLKLYETCGNRGDTRPTDASEASLQWVLNRINSQNNTLLDVGCGRGYWLERCQQDLTMTLTGCDMLPNIPLKAGEYQQAWITALPFPDKSFDVVTCFHVLEHIPNLDLAISELKRVTRHQLFLMVPCQRPYRYTLDLHLHFFHSTQHVQSLVGLKSNECEAIGFGKGDLVYLANIP